MDFRIADTFADRLDHACDLRRPCRQRCADLALGKRLWRALRRLCQIDRTPARREAA